MARESCDAALGGNWYYREHSIDNLAKHNVLVVEPNNQMTRTQHTVEQKADSPVCFCARGEELATVSVGAAVGHGQNTGSRVR